LPAAAAAAHSLGLLLAALAACCTCCLLLLISAAVAALGRGANHPNMYIYIYESAKFVQHQKKKHCALLHACSPGVVHDLLFCK
jgi:hypothetical protein